MSCNFADALEAAFDGHAIQRSGWNGKNQFVRGQFPDAGSKMTQPYLYIEQPAGPGASNTLTPWVPSQGDLFAIDWLVI